MAKKTIADIEVQGYKVLMRVDFNVPLQNGQITDDRRIQQAIPSIKSVIDRGGRLILISHLGRPQGQGHEADFSLAPCAHKLGQLLGKPVAFVPDCIGQPAIDATNQLNDGDILLLENLRFYKQEKQGDADFSQQLADLADIYCNDAFGTAHRQHASMAGVPRAMGDKPKVAGFLMQKEIKYLADTLANPARPFTAILGGAKVSDKIPTITHLIGQVDDILIGGAMTYTFMLAQKIAVGNSLIEKESVEQASIILKLAKQSNTHLHLPCDHVCAQTFGANVPTTVYNQAIAEGWLALDIGPETIAQYVKCIAASQTIVWNGPMGAFETPPFDRGTHAIADAIGQATDNGATSIIGGGDSAAAISQFKLDNRVTHISTGGGASLQMLQGKSFASVQLLDEKTQAVCT